ncbi:MAG: hypothetical protein M1381_03630 [Deltaproteobacteria bacterium]|nr:hypothetical protein [Deltaproteobacteria bacterium]MCL5792525.1 hypothetical protein [Deltaproteobacteria bacterium]
MDSEPFYLLTTFPSIPAFINYYSQKTATPKIAVSYIWLRIVDLRVTPWVS